MSGSKQIEKAIADLLFENRCIIEETQVFGEGNVTCWHSCVIDANNNPISGGFSIDRNHSRKIALAEFIERKTFLDISNSNDEVKNSWGLNVIPTACGFAAGFNRANTILRSIHEATERWVMSLWIDNDLWIEELKSDNVIKNLDPISLFFVSQFEKVLFFQKSVSILINNKILEVKVGQTMGLSEKGIFPGSSAQITGGNIWQHALLESYRHLLAIKNNPDRGDIFPDNKVHFFSKNKQVALNQIYKEKNNNWPIPKVLLHNETSLHNNCFFVARTILSDWKSWDQGPIERFLY